jgi:hypothetical protein
VFTRSSPFSVATTRGVGAAAAAAGVIADDTSGAVRTTYKQSEPSYHTEKNRTERCGRLIWAAYSRVTYCATLHGGRCALATFLPANVRILGPEVR